MILVVTMITMKPEDIVKYKPQDEVSVKIVGFDEEKFYNPITKQMQHIDPYVVEDGILKKCNIKPVLSLV